MLDKDILTNRVKQLETIIAKKQHALLNAPAGSMQANPKGKQTYFDLIENGQRRHLKMTDQKDQALARGLAQKAYDENILKKAEKEKAALTRLVKLYDSGCAEDYYASLNRGRRQLINPIRLPDDEYAVKWQARKLGSRHLSAEAAPFKTDRGEYVRSKSEMLIANKLHACGICYHYEPSLTMTDHQTGSSYTAHPDFVVLNARSRRELLWEHFGMMDNTDYVNHNLRKLRDYENAGYHLGDRLIATFETLKMPLDSAYIDKIIHQYGITGP